MANHNFRNLSGIKFGRLKAIEKAGKYKNNKSFLWKCLCDCGKEKIILGQNLTEGYTKSCGCLKREVDNKRIKLLSKINITHGETRGRKASYEYSAWRGMKERCLNMSGKDYKNYGLRGINICEEWLGEQGFQVFLKDMGRRPQGCSLDRIDNNKGYSHSNCRWADLKIQRNNIRTKEEIFNTPIPLVYDIKKGFSFQFEYV